MLPRQHRLTRGDDFRRVLRRGVRDGYDFGLVSAIPAEVSQFGFVVSKAVGNAVERNKAKRKLRAAARMVLQHATSAAVVVRASRGVLEASVSEMAEALGHQMSRANKK